MKPLTLGIIREGKEPPDQRVPLTPQQCRQLMETYPKVEVCVESSPIRCFPDESYLSEGISVQQDVSHCDILMGIKEVPVYKLIPDKTYMFFSHTIKKQPHNKKLLQTILEKNILLIDYECLTNSSGIRIIGFGRYAGIVGCYNGFLTYGKKYNVFDLKPANQCEDRNEMEKELKKVKLSDIKIVLTGDGRVANGALEILQKLSIKRVTPENFLSKQWDEAIYTRLTPQHYVKNKSNTVWNLNDFFQHPENYSSTFLRYTHIANMYIACHFWHPLSPVFFSKEDMKNTDFQIKVIADISCDVNGPIPSTIRASSIQHPIYGYNPQTEKETNYKDSQAIAVMAVDNLPCELPKDASQDFGEQLLHRVFPYLFGEDKDAIIDRATITRNGRITRNYSYLHNYVS